MSAAVFGIEKPVHLKGDFARETENINSGVYEESPREITVLPRVRTYREKAKRSGIVDRTAEKEAVRAATAARLEAERALLKSYIKDGRLEFSALPEITPQIRDVFLNWLSRGLENKSQRAKTEDGRPYRIVLHQPGETCTLSCTDGTLRMPAYTILFEE